MPKEPFLIGCVCWLLSGCDLLPSDSLNLTEATDESVKEITLDDGHNSDGVGGHSTLVLRAEADASVRTDLDARANDNYGCGMQPYVGASRGGGGIPYGKADAMRSLVRFDLSGVDEPVARATLKLTIRVRSGLPSGGNLRYTVDVHRIVESGTRTPWIEGNGSQNDVPPATCSGTGPAYGAAWIGDGDGGDSNNQTAPDFDPSAAAGAEFDDSTCRAGTVVQWDITTLVNDWITRASSNFGLVLRDITSDGYTFKWIEFCSREDMALYPDDPNAGEGPVLLLEY
jgi:hypothetical protein